MVNQMSKKIEMTGKQFGNLTVIGESGKIDGQIAWRCVCDCGNEVIVRGYYLRSGHTKSCKRCNTYINHGDYTEVRVKNQRSFFIDSADVDLVKTHQWSVQCDGYVSAYDSSEGVISLHQFLMGFPQCIVDHADRNPSNNRRSNLRLATHIENMYNRKRQSNNTSGYIGVCFNKNDKAFIARVTAKRITYLLGSFKCAKDAALTRDLAALRYQGEFAHLNFPIEEVLKYEETNPLKEEYSFTIKASQDKTIDRGG